MIESNNNRHTIATRSYVKVHVSTPDEDYMGRNTGGWWPYRIQHYTAATDPTVNRTRDRSLSYALTSQPEDHIGPYDLLPLAADLNANTVIPRPLIGDEPYMHGIAEYIDKATEICPETDICIPINATYAAYSSLLFHELDHKDKRNLRHHTTFALDNCAWMNETDLITAAKELRQQLGNSIHIHLTNITPTANLAQQLRSEPDLVDSLNISPRFLNEYLEETEDTPGIFESDLLSRDGRRDLATSLDPAVRLAAEFSYLTSPLYETTHFDTIADRTTIPIDNSHC